MGRQDPRNALLCASIIAPRGRLGVYSRQWLECVAVVAVSLSNVLSNVHHLFIFGIIDIFYEENTHSLR